MISTGHCSEQADTPPPNADNSSSTSGVLPSANEKLRKTSSTSDHQPTSDNHTDADEAESEDGYPEDLSPRTASSQSGKYHYLLLSYLFCLQASLVFTPILFTTILANISADVTPGIISIS